MSGGGWFFMISIWVVLSAATAWSYAVLLSKPEAGEPSAEDEKRP